MNLPSDLEPKPPKRRVFCGDTVRAHKCQRCGVDFQDYHPNTKRCPKCRKEKAEKRA